MGLRLDKQGYEDAKTSVEAIDYELQHLKQRIKELNEEKRVLNRKIKWYENTEGKELRSGENTDCFKATGKRFSDLTDEERKAYLAKSRRDKRKEQKSK